ncbi:MAG: nucleotide exchange factor GrpE [Bacillales bacterium]|nr:nucleotide exchange factor GrpE [Bacillales bacterium]
MEKENKKKTIDILEDEPTEDKTAKTSKKDAELELLKEENKKLFNEKETLNTKYLMALAEQQNYKKRIDEEQQRFYKYNTFEVSKELVKVLDSFDLAIEKDSEDERISAYLKGFKMIRNSIFSLLEKEGVKEIEAKDKPFDPNLMISVGARENSEKEDQTVLDVLLKGYMYKDRLLRAANVIISTVPEKEPENAQKEEIQKEETQKEDNN